MTPPLEGILETALYADDLDAAERFYGNILGLERITRHENRHVFFRCGPGVLLIFNAKETVVPPPSSAFPVPPHGMTDRDMPASAWPPSISTPGWRA